MNELKPSSIHMYLRSSVLTSMGVPVVPDLVVGDPEETAVIEFGRRRRSSWGIPCRPGPLTLVISS